MIEMVSTKGGRQTEPVEVIAKDREEYRSVESAVYRIKVENKEAT